jgi:hypothetical protein
VNAECLCERGIKITWAKSDESVYYVCGCIQQAKALLRTPYMYNDVTMSWRVHHGTQSAGQPKKKCKDAASTRPNARAQVSSQSYRCRVLRGLGFPPKAHQTQQARRHAIRLSSGPPLWPSVSCLISKTSKIGTTKHLSLGSIDGIKTQFSPVSLPPSLFHVGF